MTSPARVCAVAFLAIVLAPAAFAVTQPVPHHGRSRSRAAAAEYDGYPLVAARLPASPSRPLRPAAAMRARDITEVGSLNWAGYAVWGKRLTFTAVRATFFVPYVQCTRSKGGTRSSHWVGIDGFERGSDSVEQVGVAADCSPAGKASYYAWFEMFPLPETRLRLAVKAGDSITASVTYSPAPARFRLALADNTRGEHVAVQHTCPDVRIGRSRLRCLRNSAEAVSEAPAIRVGKNLTIAALTDYGAVSFAAISVTDAGGAVGGPVFPSWQTTKIIELRSSGGAVVALPTPTQGATFDTYWARP